MNKAILALLFLLSGCAEKITERIVYQDVYVPVKCGISVPVKPEPNDSAALMIVDLINYTHELEYALNACKGE